MSQQGTGSLFMSSIHDLIENDVVDNNDLRVHSTVSEPLSSAGLNAHTIFYAVSC